MHAISKAVKNLIVVTCYQEVKKKLWGFMVSSPHLSPKNLGRIFSKKSFPWETFWIGLWGEGGGDGGKFKSYSVVCWWRRGELVWPGDKPAEEVHLNRLWVGVNFTWYLTVVVIFMGLGGSKSLVGSGGFKVIIWGRAS